MSAVRWSATWRSVSTTEPRLTASPATPAGTPIANELDEYEHFGNRRLRTTGELIQEAFRIGLYRMERVVRERMTTSAPSQISTLSG